MIAITLLYIHLSNHGCNLRLCLLIFKLNYIIVACRPVSQSPPARIEINRSTQLVYATHTHI